MDGDEETSGRPEGEQLRRSMEVLRTLVEQNIIGVYVIQDDVFRFVNDTFARIFGYERHEVVNRLSPIDVVAEGDRETVARNLRLRREGEVDAVHYAFDGLRKDGSEVRVEVHGSRAELDGRPAISGVLLDISEQEALQEQLREAQKREALAELTGTVAHDFNNFLTGISGSVELALDDLDPDSAPAGHLELARTTAQRAEVLARRLLTFSRKDVTHPETFDLNRVVGEMGELLVQLVGSPVHLDVETASEPLPVHLDPGHMEQVVMNLVLNGRDAVPDGGTVRVRTRPAGGAEALVEVSDDGHGMDEETLGEIFSPFFTTKDTGTGLGLATTRRIVEKAGGTIEVESSPGEGATFRVRLPIAEGAADEDEGEGAAEAARQGGPEGAREPGPARVLVVEDDDAVRKMVRAALVRHGHDVCAVRTAAAALEVFDGGDEEEAGDGSEAEGGGAREEPTDEDGASGQEGADGPPDGLPWAPELLFADLSLPDRTGAYVAREFLETLRGGRVVLTSGYAPEHWPGGDLGDVPHVFLEKPFSIDELLAGVDAALGGDLEGGSEGPAAGGSA